MDMFYIPRAFLHYRIIPDSFPDHPDTDLVIDVEHRTVYLNLDADPHANIVKTIFPRCFTPEETPKKKRWGVK